MFIFNGNNFLTGILFPSHEVVYTELYGFKKLFQLDNSNYLFAHSYIVSSTLSINNNLYTIVDF